ncbi:baseplate J/gp47 family protein [Bartonella vinsonii]|uniref:Phage baseplate assembly protein GpJ n=2 Tax=Bartonella TaxID=773 RepID=N6UQZ4_BARVB|nr:baseplate J/gp47 family protein [Bartonella vinsonii]AGF75848.1 phage baseplate assembly protein GpJ [Bartonella vinsonii subsp. berkhoffii str. Winnie]ENN93170.1 phage baseplate assembly protein GpJ [Bartonella vinsonii subsp. berkhoffii str. Tweed]ENN94264.1 phage baseplate assembly protein GpJ [Bartonella vinsonii subsp. berkhoffii str. Tweed]ENN94779.1 phage baseplate assembly protein GpJ [Bartonella vinsonii subsp. berkhoffii str. Tweed]ENN95494.1 phage baseplate assembly protein GpJ [
MTEFEQLPLLQIPHPQLLLPQVVEELSVEAILQQKITRLTKLLAAHHIPYNVEKTAYDPVVIQLQAAAYEELLLRQRVNEVARDNLLEFARGTSLDHLGDFHGVVRLLDEDDERFRRRIRLNRQGHSTGGTAPRYQYFALSSDIHVKDAFVYRVGKSPLIHVALFSDSPSGVADEALIAKVQAALDDKHVKMTNDHILVKSAVQRIINVRADLWLLPDENPLVLEKAEQNLRAEWVRAQKLGRDLSLSWIISRLMVEGVHHVTLTQPCEDLLVAPDEAVAVGEIVLSERGRAY